MKAYDLIIIIVVSLLPGVEARGAIPVAFALGVNPLVGFIIVYLASSSASIPIIYLLETVEEKIIRKSRRLSWLYDKLLVGVRKRALKVSRYRLIYVGLGLYVAIPLPLTGVWTGSLIAYLLGLNPVKSIITIFLGNLAASILVFLIVSGIVTLI